MTDLGNRDLRAEVGQLVTELLEQKGLTQKRAAELTRRRAAEMGGRGLRREQVGRLARGETSPSLVVIIKLVDGLDMKLSEFAELLEQQLSADDGPRRS